MSNIKNTVLVCFVVLFTLIGCDTMLSNPASNYMDNGGSGSPREIPDSFVIIKGIQYNLSADQSSYAVAFTEDATGDVIIESYINNIPVTKMDRSFSGNENITSITVPETIKELPGRFAAACINLTKVTLHDSITSIGYAAFYYCTSLASITIPPKVTSIPDNAFYHCTSLTEITIPSGIESIGVHNFMYCSSLSSITLSYGLKTIGTNFCEGTLLNKVVIPASVRSIDASDFQACANLNTIIVQAATPPALSAGAFSGIASDAVYIVPAASLDAYRVAPVWSGKNLAAASPAATVTINGIEYSLNAAANGYNAKNAAAAPVDATVESSIDGLPVSINSRLFATNKRITSLTIKHGITQIPAMMCYQTTNLVSVTLPDTITSIAGYAFAECAALKSVNIPSGVTSIAERTFKKSTALEEISIPSSVTSIGSYAFINCSGLKKIHFSEGLQAIGNMAFAYVNALTEVVLPASVTAIDYLAFTDCTALITVTVKAENPPILGDNPFIRIAPDAVFYVPATSLVTYKTVPGWSALNLAAIP